MINLPIDAVLPDIIKALESEPRLVLVAPPGAGKTTRLPLALMPHFKGKIVVIEPRRLAARSAATRMAGEINEIVGQTVGLLVRFEAKISPKTRIELMTEGVFTRMILDDPELTGIDLVIFDEFHERSLEADFGLALALDVQAAWRDDLKILVMSATLDGAAVAKLMTDAPIIRSEGRAYHVISTYVGRNKSLTLEEQMARVIQTALATEAGSLLVFLPGMSEIRRTSLKLRERISEPAIDIVELYGAMDQVEQSKAIEKPLDGRRKIVLATSIAETSITIEGVRVVIDSGLSRVPRFEPDIGVTRLETVRSPKSVNEQRKGRAGRTEPGICYRLWEEREEGSLAAFATPEILSADLSSLLLDCAEWGCEPQRLLWQDAPPLPALSEAKTLLMSLEAFEEGRITQIGKELRRLPFPPRFAKMVLEGEKIGYGVVAIKLAVILSEKGLGGDAVNLEHRLDHLKGSRSQALKQAMSRIKHKGIDDNSVAARLLLFAFPERLAKARGKTGQFILATGRGVFVDPSSDLARFTYLAVAEVTGSAQNTRILAAAPISEEEVYSNFKASISEKIETFLDDKQTLRSRKTTSYGKITLKEAMLPVEATHENALLLAQGVFENLPFSKAQQSFMHRLAIMNEKEPDLWPTATLSVEILAPFLIGKTGIKDMTSEDLDLALQVLADYHVRKRLDIALPSHFIAPTGNSFALNYEGDEPILSIRVPELYGLREHPHVGNGKIPLLIELLSPAHKPVQITRDLIGFWQGSYNDVRIEMKGRYPRHHWPEDPMAAMATARAKPRGT